MDHVPELNEAFRQALLETIPCAVVILDARRRIVYWNRSAEELTGYPAGEMLGQSCDTIAVQSADRQDPEVIEAMCPFREQADGAHEQCRILRKDGTELPVVRIARTVTDASGTLLGAIQAIVDVSVIERSTQEIRRLRREVARTGRYGQILGASERMRSLFEMMELVADTDASVVIEGETGTGKELVARTLHAQGARGKGPFVAVHCAALPETLLEAELFGHVRGAFTGAVADRPGRFEEAVGGTIFLDEVSEVPLSAQVKLLRVLQEREVTRVGENAPRSVDVRVLAATNRDLAGEVAAGRFREDLYYRLRVVALRVPPLRSRREDIPDLVAHFLDRYNRKYQRHVEGLEPAAMQRLLRSDWPGNVRQLEHAIEHAFAVSPRTATVLAASALPADVQQASPPGPSHGRRSTPPADERDQVEQALRQAGGNKSQAARILGLTRMGLYKKIKRLGLTDPQA
ncbi:MAG TPA: sigma 54-interacting transcriptional regulator [Phycisphaerae bacterium]|nr:sigma 54-interacting transcriptional regulator [Phycisphaerae bacterium]